MRNQCDGCAQGLPKIDGIHYKYVEQNLKGRVVKTHLPWIACTAKRYEEPVKQ